MSTAALGQVREHHASVGSSNDRALAWAREGAPHGAVVTCDEQTAGRGRLGRRWASPAGEGLYASVVLRPQAYFGAVAGGGWSPRWSALGLAVGLGLYEGLARWLPQAQLKWPNDLLVGGRKLAGVLCETRWQGATPDVVVGFGINVRQREFPAELQATSLMCELSQGTCPGRSAVLEAALVGLEGVLGSFFAGGFPAIRGRYEAHSAVVGRALKVGEVAVEGVGFDDDGALRVRPPGGASWRVESEDVWLREPEA